MRRVIMINTTRISPGCRMFMPQTSENKVYSSLKLHIIALDDCHTLQYTESKTQTVSRRKNLSFSYPFAIPCYPFAIRRMHSF